VIVDAVRAVARHLEHAETGVNVQLAALPLAEGEAPPPAVTVCDSVRHAWVSRLQIDRKTAGPGRLLLVAPHGELVLPLDAAAVADRADLEVALRYVGRANNSATLARDAAQTLRAALRAIRLGFEREATTLGGPHHPGDLALDAPSAARFIPQVDELRSDDLLVDGLVLTIPLFDPWATALDALGSLP